MLLLNSGDMEMARLSIVVPMIINDKLRNRLSRHKDNTIAENAKQCYDKGLPLIDKCEFDYWIAQANYAVAVAKLGDPKKAEKMISEAEARGYTKGDVIRKMAGIKKKTFFSRLFG